MIKRLIQSDMEKVRAFFGRCVFDDKNDFVVSGYNATATAFIFSTGRYFPAILESLASCENEEKGVSIFRAAWQQFVVDERIRVLKLIMIFPVNQIGDKCPGIAFHVFPCTSSLSVRESTYLGCWVRSTKHVLAKNDGTSTTTSSSAHTLFLVFPERTKNEIEFGASVVGDILYMDPIDKDPSYRVNRGFRFF